ncbi:MAG: alpha/beta fold hydrolase, partial [Candidatus Eremiobacteraeota bacterium]|nr:alpha/beta fold hydrolase [Candidatus Eremiobacteraeota bacterium]
MPQRRHVIVDGTRLETLVYAVPRPSLPTIVLLHEALGSARSWNRFAPRLAAATGRGVVAYSRQGAGSSDPLQQPRQRDYLQREAEAVLPALLHACGIDRPILFGHSDGASIALVYAGAFPSHTGALILEAPHVFVEQITLAGIEHAARDFHHGELRAKLARYHDDVDSVFAAWHD